MRQAGEPSVEEILASIKKVIARDSRSESGRSESPRDVLDLGDIAAHVLGTGAGAGPGTATRQDDEALLTEATTGAMRESLAALALLATPGAQPQIVRAGETSLEGLVRELLRPMLSEWLDRNLPAMVERMVAAEIARIARKKG